MAEKVKQELRLRRMVIRGTMRPHRTYAFSGLVVCGTCGRHLVVGTDTRGNRKLKYMRCMTPYNRMLDRACDQGRNISHADLQATVHRLLEMLLDGADFTTESPAPPPHDTQEREITQLETQIRKLITKQAQADDALSSLYDEQLTALAHRLKASKEALVASQRNQASQLEQFTQRHTSIEELRALELERFWELEGTKINQALHAIFGAWRLVVLNREVVGLFRVSKRLL